MSNKLIVSGVVVAVIFSVAAFFSGATERIVERVEVGGAAGPDHYNHQYFKQSYTRGGTDIATTSTASTYTLTNAELRDDVNYISWTPNINTTLTTQASTSAPFVGLQTGETRELILYNASTTAAATITFAAGTGVDLQEDEGGSVIVNGLEAARITYFKKADSDIGFVVEPFQVGD